MGSQNQLLTNGTLQTAAVSLRLAAHPVTENCMLQFTHSSSPLLLSKCVQLLFTNSDRTSQETHYVSATKPNRLMLFRETIAVYCENHKEHIFSHAKARGTKSQNTYTHTTHIGVITFPSRFMHRFVSRFSR
jgi:hypothetical protein